MTTSKAWLMAGLLCLTPDSGIAEASEEAELIALQPVFPARALALQHHDSGPKNPVLVWIDHIRLRADRGTDRLLMSIDTGQRAMTTMEAMAGAVGNWMLLGAVDGLASNYGALGRYAEAEPLLKRALAMREEFLEPEHWKLAGLRNHLALAYHLQGKTAEAEAAYERALSAAERASDDSSGVPADISLSATLNNLALFRQSRGDFGQVAPLFERALEILKLASNAGRSGFAFQAGATLNNFATFHTGRESYDKAEALFRLALENFAIDPNTDEAIWAMTQNNLAELYRRQGRHSEAEPYFKQAVSSLEATLGPDDLYTALVLEGYAALLRETGRDADAEDLATRAEAIRAGSAKND